VISPVIARCPRTGRPIRSDASDVGTREASLRSASGRPTVAIARGTDPATTVREAVGLVGGLAGIVRPGQTVVLKVNLTIPSDPGRGNVTDSRVLRAVIELCQAAGAGQIVVCDGSGGGDSTAIMRRAGYEPVLKDTGATFVDLNADSKVTRKLPDFDGRPEYQIARTAAEAPVLISLPVLKVHRSAGVSLAGKNLIGTVALSPGFYPRQQIHDAGVQRVTADLVRIRPPDFAIVDGTVGLEGDSPMYGTPVKMGLVIAGQKVPSVDAVGAAVMGIDPAQLEQLQLLRKRGQGEIDLGKIAIRGQGVSQVRRAFAR
jgi:uncharacterized protein (DUF362 family)